MTNSDIVGRLTREWETQAQQVREIDADESYRHYWRGYAVALEGCARVLRARAALSGSPEG